MRYGGLVSENWFGDTSSPVHAQAPGVAIGPGASPPCQGRGKQPELFQREPL